jgi:hypothetical protein
LTIFNALDVPTKGVQILFGHKKNGAFPLDLAWPKCLSVIFVIQLQLKKNKKI